MYRRDQKAWEWLRLHRACGGEGGGGKGLSAVWEEQQLTGRSGDSKELGVQHVVFPGWVNRRAKRTKAPGRKATSTVSDKD